MTLVAAPPRDAKGSPEHFAGTLLSFDGVPGLLDHRFSFGDLLIWPLIRWTVLWRATEAGLGFQPYFARPKSYSMGRNAAYAWNAWKRRPTKGLKPFDIVWFGSAGGVVLKKEGKWFGRVNDYLADTLPDRTLLIEESAERVVKFPRYLPNVRAHDYFRLRSMMSAKLGRGPSSQDAEAVEGFLVFLRREFPLDLGDGFENTLRRNLMGLAARLPSLHRSYTDLFRKTRPKVVFVEDGCYGYHSYIIRWARDMGIKTAEFQHGAVVPSHVAYNYGPGGFRPEYARHLPDYLLTHGRFWSENTRLPCTKVVLGNPHFQANIDRATAAADSPREERLLIVSQGDVTDRLVALARDLHALSPGFPITFRLHPAEVNFAERYESLHSLPGITVSTSGDIYELIRASTWVVGVSSTTIFEATGMDKPVFVLDTPNARFYTPKGFGTWIPDAARLLESLRKHQPPHESLRDSIWASDWRGNYARFLEGDIGIGAGA